MKWGILQYIHEIVPLFKGTYSMHRMLASAGLLLKLSIAFYSHYSIAQL